MTPTRYRIGDNGDTAIPVGPPRFPTTPAEVAERLAAAADVRRRMPDDRLLAVTAAERIERAAGRTPGWGRDAQPSALEISMADEAERWLSWLKAPDPKIVMGRAHGDSFRRITEKLGMNPGYGRVYRRATDKRMSARQLDEFLVALSVSTVKRRYAVALALIAANLAKGLQPPGRQDAGSVAGSANQRRRAVAVPGRAAPSRSVPTR